MRGFLKGAAAVAVLAITACGNNNTTPAAGDPPSPATATPKNVVFFLGDGYGIVPMTSTRIYAVGESGELAIDTLPETAFIKTFSKDAQVTDSAPSMSAYMTGVKMDNGVISMSADTQAFDTQHQPYVSGADSTCPATDGTPVTTLLELAVAAKRSTGVVTTTRITHATPAATYSHICHRDGENDIATQLVPGGAGYNAKLGNGVDVVLGGGSRHFVPSTTKGSKRTDTRNLIDEMKAKGYTYVANEAEFTALPDTTTKLLGLFTASHMSYDLDRDPTTEPSLAEMTTKAIDILAKNPNGYFLMVEGGRIDHALHETTARKALQDGKAFDDAMAAALAKVDLKNTLVVVTADHDHTMGMNGYSTLTGKTTDTYPGILGLMRDYHEARNADGSAPADITTKAPKLDANGKPFTTLVFGIGENRIGGNRNTQPDLTDPQVADKNYHQEAVVQSGPGGETHGGADVLLGAAGLGADQFHGTLDNTKVFDLIKNAVGL
ncbi:MAG: alkaline phosphatase [Nevskiaceae bacterium]|nr:MAG: alkaline phosphatase [Nevskiaceae bacterium]TBR71650.1 MAG: alkaline phosphatase [Nevskiaceae bacterium]